MNTHVKWILLGINVVMLIFAVSWYYKEKVEEPLIAIAGQVATILGLIFEQRVSKVINKRIKNQSTIDVDINSGDVVKNSDIDNSKINVKTK